jgi:Glycosyltransferase family 87
MSASTTSPRVRTAAARRRSPLLGDYGAWALFGVLLALVAINLPELGSDPWPFRPPAVEPGGVLAPLVRAAGQEWDVGIARAACFLAGLLVTVVAALHFRRRTLSARAAGALVLVVGAMLLAPSTLLQMGLRQSTAPWFHTNDSTYQIELGGDLLLHGENPYGHDYRSSGLERFYTFDGTISRRVLRREVALRHYAYFPGTTLTAVPWRLLPTPFDDYRLFVVLTTLASFFAVMAFRAPLSWRLVVAAVVVANPIAVRSSWFGQNDAPSLLFLLLSFALFTRSRYGWSAASLGAAVLLKQFAIVAVPFLAVMMVKRGLERPELRRAALTFAGVVAAGVLPFLVWDPAAFYQDTIKYGAGTYRIVGYGLSAILVRLGVIASREGSYPFALLALVVWLPLTAYLLLAQWRARELWLGAAGFSISMLVLLFIGRTFNNYYLIWPLTGAAAAAVMAAASAYPETRRRSTVP